MSTLKQSWDRLRAERWCNNPSIASKSDATARFQKLADGSGSYVHDEYKVVIVSMPPLLSAEAYLLELARSPNNATNHGLFNAVNRFTRRSTEAPGVGDIYDIDIMGPDNGSIVLVELSPGFGTHQSEGAWFDIQTISCEKYGSHPEAGTREFGFEYTKHGVGFYTRGVSRPGNFIIGMAGAGPQMMGWTAMMKGISEGLRARGGRPKENSFTALKELKL